VLKALELINNRYYGHQKFTYISEEIFSKHLRAAPHLGVRVLQDRDRRVAVPVQIQSFERPGLAHVVRRADRLSEEQRGSSGFRVRQHTPDRKNKRTQSASLPAGEKQDVRV